MNTSVLIPRPLLHPLTELGSTDLHFVADDYSGSGNWVSRDSNAWVATLHGAATKATATQFANRHDITGWSASNYFELAANSAHSISGSTTYEIIVAVPTEASVGAAYEGSLVASGGAGAAGAYELLIDTSGSSGGNPMWRSEQFAYNNAAAQLFDEVSIRQATYDGTYVMFTCVTDAVGNRAQTYVNGAASGAGAAISTTFQTATAMVLRIGAWWNVGSLIPTNVRIVEIVRHQAALSATQIAARAAQFNVLKGY